MDSSSGAQLDRDFVRSGDGQVAASRALVRPAENLQLSASIFNKGGTAFNPVSVIDVEYSSDVLAAA